MKQIQRSFQIHRFLSKTSHPHYSEVRMRQILKTAKALTDILIPVSTQYAVKSSEFTWYVWLLIRSRLDLLVTIFKA